MSSKKKEKSFYEKFRDRCKYWRNELGINDVMIDVEAGFINSHPVSYEYDPQARTALIMIDEDYECVSDSGIDYLAFHELSHIKYANLEYMVKRRDYSGKELEIELHRLIIADWRNRKG